MFSWEKLKVYTDPMLKAFLIFIIGYIIVKCITRIFKRALYKTSIDKSLVKFIVKTVKIILYILVIMSSLSSIGVSTSGVLAALSAAAVGVAVALKDSLSNVAGGILLLISPRFTTGDYIEVLPDSGTVISVDLLHTTIRTPDNKQVSIPNGVLINSHITNYTRETTRRLDLTIPVSYDADIEKAKTVIKSVIESHELSLNEPDEPIVRVLNYNDSSVDITARVWVNTKDFWNLRFDIVEQARAALNKEGISIPYNQLDVHIKNY